MTRARPGHGIGRVASAAPLLSLLIASGCHMGVNPISIGPGPEVRSEWAGEAVAAHRDLLRAINAGDAHSIEGALDDAAVMWIPDLQYVGGSDVVAELDEILGTGTGRIRLVHTGSETCLDESLLSAAVERNGDDPGETMHVSVQWSRKEGSGWRATQIRFVDPHPVLTDMHDSCQWVRDREQFVMRDRSVSVTFDPQFLLRGQRDSELAPWEDGVRVEARLGHRLRGRTWVELMVAGDRSVDDESEMNDELRRREAMIGALVGYEVGLARLGLGLAYSSTAWAWYRPGIRSDRLNWSRTALGAIAEASTSMPLRQGFSLEGRVSGRTFGKTIIEPSADRPLTESGGVRLGLDFGVGYRF